LKVLFIIQRSQLRGAENFACQLATELISKGHHVDVVFLFFGIKGLEDCYPHLNFISLGANERLRFFDFVALKKLNKLIRSQGYDIVQANAGDTLKYAVLSKVLFRWTNPIVFRNASMVSQYIDDPLIKLINRWLYRYTKAIISVATATRDDLQKLFPELRKKMHVVPIGIQASERPILEKRPLQVVHIGGFTFEKNHKGLIRIFIEIRKQVPAATLLLVGDGPLRRSIEEKVRRFYLQDCVTFTGSVSNPLYYLSQSSVLVLPSRIEGLGAVIIEAFYCHVPVVAYTVGGVKDAIQDKVTGRLIAPGDEIAFANAVTDVLLNPNKYRSMVETASRSVATDYSIENLANDFLNVWQTLPSENNVEQSPSNLD
jgi:L-malate glycosyltransferase